LAYDNATNTCLCQTGFYTYQTSEGPRCILQELVNRIFSGANTADVTLSGANVRNTGSPTGAYVSFVTQQAYSQASVGCLFGNSTACNALANLCVLSNYDLRKTACAAYRQLQLREDCRGLGCEIPSTVPWLFYLRSSVDILRFDGIKLKLSLQSQTGYVDRLRIILASYAINGTFLGHTLVTDQLDLCDIATVSARQFYTVGARREVQCNLNLKWYFQAPETAIHELFLEDIDGTLIDIPAMLLFDPESSNFVPENTEDPRLFRSASSGDPVSGSYKRRFFLYDNVGSRSGTNERPAFVTYARRVQLMFTLQPGHSSKIYPPLLLIQYASVLASDVTATTDFTSGALMNLRTNVTSGDLTDRGIDRVLYVQNTNEALTAARWTIGVLCVLVFFTAFARAYGWMRRQQDMILGFGAIFRFVIFYFNHLSNLFALFIFLFCGIFYIFFKHQASVDYLLPENYVYLTATLYVAVVMKAFVVFFYIYEQTNADLFVIDWERSKGVLKNTEKEVSVSMWRSTFIANEFNEMQTLRGFHVLPTMFVVAAFLEGAGFIELARSVPSSDNITNEFTISHTVLRIAVAMFFWLIVGIVFYVLEHWIYYKFIKPHPLQAFVDLCSVSNISIMVLLEPQWGFYIHGESIHAHADASMEEFQRNLKQEAQGNLPQRGFAQGGGGGNQQLCQVFEVFLGAYMRQFLNVSYSQLYAELMHAGSAAAAVGPNGNTQGGMHRQHLMPPVQNRTGCFEFLRNRFPVNLTPETLNIKKRINQAFQASVREARRSVLSKFGLHQHINFPPNILFMNGPFAGEKAGGDLFFIDEVKAYGQTLLYGLDFDIFILYMLLFVAIDTGLHNIFGSIAITYILEVLIYNYRANEGEANIARKTLFDDRFFL
jgi:meckelin